MTRVLPLRVLSIGTLLLVACARKAPDATAVDAGGATPRGSAATAAMGLTGLTGLGAPLAAALRPSGEVVVVGFDAAKRAVRAVRVGEGERVTASGVVFEDVEASPESDLKVLSAGDGLAVVWRGKQKGALVRRVVSLDENLAPRRAPADIGAAFCATKDAVVHVEGGRAESLPHAGGSVAAPLGGDGTAEATVVCSPSRAFVLLEGDDDTRFAPFDAKLATKPILRERDFGKDELRERSDLVVGDELVVVRIGASSVTLRETKGGEPLAPTRLETPIRQEHDVVAVDASDAFVLVVFTEDAGESCPDKVGPWTKVKALRVDRATHAESVVALGEGACGHELGPFTTNRLGAGIAVTWIDRVPTQGKSRAPIAGFSHASVSATSATKAAHVAEPADALVDAGCAGTQCWMVSLRRGELDAAASGTVHVRAYAP